MYILDTIANSKCNQSYGQAATYNINTFISVNWCRSVFLGTRTSEANILAPKNLALQRYYKKMKKDDQKTLVGVLSGCRFLDYLLGKKRARTHN